MQSFIFKEEIGFLSDKKNNRLALNDGVLSKNALPILDCDKVVSIEKDIIQETFDITTSTSEFVAGGIVVHNCEEALMNVSDLVFSGEKLDELKTISWRQNGNWEVYKEPIPGHRYAIGADVGAGQGGDPSTASILDLETNEEVACFEDRMTEPDKFAYELAQYGRYYNTAYIAPERNNVGVGVIAKLKELYPDQQIHKEVRIGTRIDRRTTKYGWMTQGNTKPKMVADMKTAILQEEILINSEKTIEQLRGYTREEIMKNGNITIKYGDKNRNGSHYDRVDALMIAWQVRADALLFAARQKKSGKMKDLMARREGRTLS